MQDKRRETFLYTEEESVEASTQVPTVPQVQSMPPPSADWHSTMAGMQPPPVASMQPQPMVAMQPQQVPYTPHLAPQMMCQMTQPMVPTQQMAPMAPYQPAYMPPPSYVPNPQTFLPVYMPQYQQQTMMQPPSLPTPAPNGYYDGHGRFVDVFRS